MSPDFTTFFIAFMAILKAAETLKCYNCVSSQPGCGKEINIRLQRMHGCPAPEEGGGANFCVKIIEHRGSQQILTRDCLMTLRAQTYHRKRMPTVQRHGYCSYARNDDPFTKVDTNIRYCFCGDWNGCNTAGSVRAMAALVFVATFLLAILQWH